MGWCAIELQIKVGLCASPAIRQALTVRTAEVLTGSKIRTSGHLHVVPNDYHQPRSCMRNHTRSTYVHAGKHDRMLDTEQLAEGSSDGTGSCHFYVV